MSQAYVCLFEKPCTLTNDCTGSFTIQELVDVNGTKKYIVRCNECNKTTDLYAPAQLIWSVSRVVKMSPFHGEDQGFDPPTDQLFSGGVMVAQRFLVPLVGVRISTGEFLLRQFNGRTSYL